MFLVERRGLLVTREQIVERIWGKNVFVDSDNGINAAISKIREALRDRPECPRFIETVTGKGYRFVAPVLTEPKASAFPPNLPARHGMIGREKEVDDICRQLRTERLMTLTGVGGVGKTTLANAVARHLAPEFPGGAYFIDLTNIRQPELVTTALAQALGLKESDCDPAALKHHLEDRKLLFVLDNFEQVLPAGAIIADLIAGTRELKVLVTSRALLQLQIEREYVVPPLTLPEALDEFSAARLAEYEAVRLFIQRARDGKTNFELTDENAAPVARICAMLDGLPLAIELAAARMKLLSPQAILARLDHRLKLLTGGSRDLPIRQQTMSAAIEWSYELLSEDDKRLFQRLAVFAGSFTFEAAENVVAVPRMLEGITSLVNQSLLVVRDTAEPRMHMLGVIREYALERLASTPEAETARKAHAAYFLDLSERAEPQLQGAEPAAWLRMLDEEYDNIREALRWALANDPPIAARIAAAIRYFWDFQGYLTEGFGILKEILSAPEVVGPVRYKLLSMAGNIAKFRGDFEIARTMYEEGLNAARAVHNLSQVSLFCRGLGGLSISEGNHPAALAFIGQALAAAREVNDRFGLARSLNMRGDLARSAGDDTTAAPLYHEALEICTQLGNRYAISNILNNLAAAEYGLKNYSAAASHFADALSTAAEESSGIRGDRIAISYAIDGSAALAVRRGEAELSARLAAAAERLREEMSFNIEPAERRLRDDYLAEARSQITPDQFSNAYAQGRTLRLHEAIALARRSLYN